MQKRHLPFMSALVIASACVADVSQTHGGDGRDDEEPEEDIGVIEQAVSIYGKEIDLNPSDLWDLPKDATCLGLVVVDEKTSRMVKCTYKDGIPAHVFFTLEPRDKGTSLKWDAARFYNAAGATPSYPRVGVFNAYPWSVKGQVDVCGRRRGDVLLRLPVVYDNVATGVVRGSVRLHHGFKDDAAVAKRANVGNLILALQTQNANGTWTDVATSQLPKPTTANDPVTLEVAGWAKPNAQVRIELRVGRDYGTYDPYFIDEVRMFAPVCVPDASGTKCL